MLVRLELRHNSELDGLAAQRTKLHNHDRHHFDDIIREADSRAEVNLDKYWDYTAFREEWTFLKGQDLRPIAAGAGRKN